MSELTSLKRQQAQLLEEVERFKIMTHYALASVMAINWDNGMNMMQVSRQVEGKLDEGLQHFQRMQRTLDSMEHDIQTSTAKVEATKQQVPCRFFAQGKCDRVTCKFSHDFTPDKTCRAKGNKEGAASLFDWDSSKSNEEKIEYDIDQTVAKRDLATAISQEVGKLPTEGEMNKLQAGITLHGIHRDRVKRNDVLQMASWFKEAISAGKRIPPPAPPTTPAKSSSSATPVPTTSSSSNAARTPAKDLFEWQTSRSSSITTEPVVGALCVSCPDHTLLCSKCNRLFCKFHGVTWDTFECVSCYTPKAPAVETSPQTTPVRELFKQ